jgi:hypothetical protein
MIQMMQQYQMCKQATYILHCNAIHDAIALEQVGHADMVED